MPGKDLAVNECTGGCQSGGICSGLSDCPSGANLEIIRNCAGTSFSCPGGYTSCKSGNSIGCYRSSGGGGRSAGGSSGGGATPTSTANDITQGLSSVTSTPTRSSITSRPQPGSEGGICNNIDWNALASAGMFFGNCNNNLVCDSKKGICVIPTPTPTSTSTPTPQVTLYVMRSVGKCRGRDVKIGWGPSITTVRRQASSHSCYYDEGPQTYDCNAGVIPINSNCSIERICPRNIEEECIYGCYYNNKKYNCHGTFSRPIALGGESDFEPFFILNTTKTIINVGNIVMVFYYSDSNRLSDNLSPTEINIVYLVLNPGESFIIDYPLISSFCSQYDFFVLKINGERKSGGDCYSGFWLSNRVIVYNE